MLQPSRTTLTGRRPRRIAIVVVAVVLVGVHLAVSHHLDGWSGSLRAVLDDNDHDDGDGTLGNGDEVQASLYGVVTLIGIARLWSMCSVGIACVGLYSIYKSNLALLRLFTLNTFLSIALDLFLLLLTMVLLSFSNPSSSSRGHAFATTLCQALSNQNSTPGDDSRGGHSGQSTGGNAGGSAGTGWWWPDLLGLSLEECEDRFDDGHVVTSLLVAVALLEGVRAFGGVKLLGYYTALAKSFSNPAGSSSTAGARYQPIPMTDSGVTSGEGSSSSSSKKNRRGSNASRGASLRVDTALAGIGGARDRYTDSPIEETDIGRRSPTSPARVKGTDRHHPGKRGATMERRDDTRILVLPRASSLDRGDVPALSLTPSTPNRSTFPPDSSSSQPSLPAQASESQMILVYQPVMMTVEEARLHGASEVALSSSHPPSSRRTRSHSSSAHSMSTHPHPPPPPSSSRSDRRSRSSTITPASVKAATAATATKPRSPQLKVVTRTTPPPPPPLAPPPPPPPRPGSFTSPSSRTITRRDDTPPPDDSSDPIDDLLTPRGEGPTTTTTTTTTTSEVGALAGLLFRGDPCEHNLDGRSSPSAASLDKKRA